VDYSNGHGFQILVEFLATLLQQSHQSESGIERGGDRAFVDASYKKTLLPEPSLFS